MGRLPLPSDFPPSLTLSIVPPLPSDYPSNLLLLLHGFGDTHVPFTGLARQLRLPCTACVALRAPFPLLDFEGFHWGDDVVFDASGRDEGDVGFTRTGDVLASLVDEVLVGKCGFARREIVMFGFGQGGAAALEFGAKGARDSELGGIVSVGAGLASSEGGTGEEASGTPVLVCAGAKGESAVTAESEDRLRRAFRFVEVKRYRRPDDGMPRSREEMLPVMQFFARRLRSRRGVPEGAVELG